MEKLNKNNGSDTVNKPKNPLGGRWNKLSFKRERERFDKILKDVNEILKHQDNYGNYSVTSTQELRDANMDSAKSGWRQYWQNRLLAELDTLPETVKTAVVRTMRGETSPPEEMTDYINYVNKRAALIRLNIQKRLEVAKLKKRLRNIDEHTDYDVDEKASRQTIYEDADGGLLIKSQNQIIPISLSDIEADYEWDKRYRPDESVSDKTWRQIRKISDLAEAKQNITRIFNEQLYYIEGVSKVTSSLPLKNIEKMTNTEELEGVIAERIIYAFFLRFQQKHPELNFTVELANPFEDAELKYDLKVSVRTRNLGVALEGEDGREAFIESKRRLGIQLTVSNRSDMLQEKTEVVDAAKKTLDDPKNRRYVKRPVDDIILVSLPLKTYGDYFRRWIENGKPSGGPEAHLTSAEKTRLIKKIIGDLLNLSDEQIASLSNE
ncbi:MAG: hypothetical protein HY226_03625 [Candidatus Vogelbacteria bacterium]|nr:hypothetical protein [Candidatus Vogelbacteria bacterium]